MRRAKRWETMLRRQDFLAVVAMFGVLGGILSPMRAEAEEPIRLGVLFSTTGPAGYVGEPGLKAIQLYVEKINQAGGLLGRQLQITSYDDATDVAKTVSFGKRLLETDKIDVMIGGTTTGSALSLAPLVEARETPLLSYAGGTSIVEPVRKWVFKVAHSDRMAAERVFQDMKKRGFTKVALMTQTTGFGQSGHTEAVKSAPKFGLTIVGDETFAPKDGDMTSQLTKLRGTDAEAIFVYGTDPECAILTKNYRQLGIKIPLYHANGVASKEFIQLSGEAANGVRLPSSSALAVEALPENDPEYPIVSRYVKDFTQKYNRDADPYGAYAYDTLMLYVDAVRRAGTMDKAKVRDAIEQTKGFMSTSGPVTMSSTDHLGLTASSLRLFEIKQGQFSLASD